MITKRFAGWPDIVTSACTLPDVVMEPAYGAACRKVNPIAFASLRHEADTSFHLPSACDEKLVLPDPDPAPFWQTKPYENSPDLLVNYRAVDTARIMNVIHTAWWDRAKQPQREALGDRP